MKVVINKCFGGFGLSLEAQRLYAATKGIALHFYKQTKYQHRDGVNEFTRVHESEGGSSFFQAHCADHGEIFNGECANEDCFYYPDIPRNDPDLLAIVKKLGVAANGQCAKLAIIEVPDDVDYEIDEYDGMEHVAEKHRTWA